MIALAILGILLGLWLAAKCERDASDDYAKGMDQYKIRMRHIHGLPHERLSLEEKNELDN
jgi:hypothetical protein